jgi:hypothetical protein
MFPLYVFGADSGVISATVTVENSVTKNFESLNKFALANIKKNFEVAVEKLKKRGNNLGIKIKDNYFFANLSKRLKLGGVKKNPPLLPKVTLD